MSSMPTTSSGEPLQPQRTQRDQPAGSGREHSPDVAGPVTQSPGPATTTTGSKFRIRVFLVAFHLERDGGQQVGHGQRHVGVARFVRFPAQRTAWGRLPKDQKWRAPWRWSCF